MTYSPGMTEAIAIADRFSGDAEAAAYWGHGAPEVDCEDLSYPGGAGQPQSARLYRGGAGPLLLYIHGGGWVGGSIALNERACRFLAQESGSDVLSISYRLAPEHPFPAGLEDCRAALSWARARFPGRAVALGGASAGANLALALALDETVLGLVLFYGVFDADFTTDSHVAYRQGYGFTGARCAEIFELYDPEGLRRSEPRICPLRAADAQLRRLPRSFLVAAELDVLRDDTLRLAERLGRLDQPHELHVEPGVTHGFINRGRLVPAADACLRRAAAFLAELDQTHEN